MAEAPQRIRWEEGRYSVCYGSVGTHKDAFAVARRTSRNGPDWILRTGLLGLDDRVAKNDDPDVLKATAESWLAEYVASLGAVFPGEGG